MVIRRGRNRRRLAYPLLVCFVLWLAMVVPGAHIAQALAEPMTSKLQLESAYLYNFLLFAHWPQEYQAKNTDQTAMTICILGNDELAETFTPVVGKAIKDSKYVLKVKAIRPPLQASDLDGCALLFIASHASGPLPEILTQIKGMPILTVSDSADFATKGGMLALVEQNGKLRWRINQGVASRVGLQFDAQLLRNADAVINAEQESN